MNANQIVEFNLGILDFNQKAKEQSHLIDMSEATNKNIKFKQGIFKE